MIELVAAIGVIAAAALVGSRRASPAPVVDAIPGEPSPEELAAFAGMSLDAYALARVLASEELQGRRAEKAAIAWVVRNIAAHDGKTVAQVVLGSAGTFGRQGGRRPVASAKPPSAEDVAIASAVLDSHGPDPTHGALQFDHPRTQDALYRSGQVSKNAAQIAEIRRVNNTLVVADGVDPGRLRFWRPKTGAA
jgi:hypothetical protein